MLLLLLLILFLSLLLLLLLLLLLSLLYYVVIIKRNDNDGKRASGIDVVEEGDKLDKGLQDIVELFNDNEKIRKEKNAAK